MFKTLLQKADETQRNKAFINQLFKDVIEDLSANEKTISKYFSPSYIQHVDGHTLNYQDFLQHMIMQKSILTFVKVSIERCIVEGNKICTQHTVNAIKKNGDSIAVKVISYFEIENGKIVLCDELTHLLRGVDEDKSIGSIK